MGMNFFGFFGVVAEFAMGLLPSAHCLHEAAAGMNCARRLLPIWLAITKLCTNRNITLMRILCA